MKMIKYCLKSHSSMLPLHRTEVVESLTALATSCVLALLLAATCNPQVAGSQQHGPVFVVEPRDVLFTPDIPGGKVSFSCSAKAKPPSMYRWIRNGNFVKKRGHVLKADAQLVLVNPTEHRDSGSYQCLASNIFGAILSHPANLQFAYLQEFQNEHRGTVAIRLGQGVMLMCAPPPHAGALVFEWVFGDSSRRPVQSDARRFISQSTGNLYIAQVDSSDVGSYRCIVQSKPTGRLTTSPPTPLTLKHGGRMGEYEPRIEVHFPPRWHVLRGENIKLECFALGNPVPSLSWRRLEGDLPSKAKLLSANALLEIPDFHPHDSGTYECRAENSAGYNTVRGKISIYAPPHWIQPIKDGEHAIDDVLQWRCKAGGKPQPTYTWLHNGMEISSEGRIHVGESGTLTINILKPVDRGMYQCRADNGHGSIFSSAELQLEVSSPDFGKSPLKLETPAARGGEARISCEPKAWPKPNFTWKRDGLKLDASNRFNILDDGTLEISDVVEHDEGSYTCTAQNALGKANSTGRLVIKASTQITIAPIDQMVSVGEKVVLPCEATHDPSLSITFSWTLDGHSVEQEQHGRHFHSRELKGHLIINSVQIRHAGNYTCTVRSTVDTVSASAELRVRGPPEPPTDLQIHDVTDATAVLSWVPGHDNHSPITQFLAQARASLFLDWMEQKTDPSPIVGEIDMAMVVGLTPWTDYEFRLIAINALGRSKSSPPSRRIRTLSAAPKIYPEGLGGGKGKRHELVITWKPIERRFRHGPDFGYIIAFRINGSHTFRQVTIPLPDAPRYTYKNTSLASFTPFEVKIRAYNVEAEGPFSPSIIVFSAEQEPNVAPASIFAKSLTSSTVEVTWEPISPNAITERIQGYQVVYSQQGDPKASLRHERVPLGENRVRLTGLRSATTYHITVQAFNTAGTGPSSPTTTVITRKGPPSKSPRLAQWWLDGSTVSLYWEQVVPMANESAVTGYKVLYRAMDQTSPHELLTNGTSAELALTGATSYVIEVRAQSDMGDGPSLQLQVPNDSSRGMKFGGRLGSACRPVTWDAMFLALLSVFVCYVRLV